MDRLAGTLSAADLHLVVMGNPFVGTVHPCKIYNILRVGSPLLYIGPQPSHISEILEALNGELPCGWANHGEVDRVIKHIVAVQQRRISSGDRRTAPLAEKFSKETLLPRMAAALEAEF
jgi:hypothetical protein